MDLRDDHRAALKESGLSDETIETYGFHSATRDQLRDALGFDPHCGGIIIPYPNGKFRVRLDVPMKMSEEGRCAKYITPKGMGNQLFLPETLDEDSFVITEGEKKALALQQSGIPAVSIPGVWCWKANKVALPELLAVRWENKRVWIAFDSDVDTNKHVKLAQDSLAHFLEANGALVRIVKLPELDGEKTGVDDFILKKGVDSFKELLKKATHADIPISGQLGAKGNRTPPHSKAVEEGVLSALLKGDRILTEDVFEILRPDDFFIQRNRALASAIYELHNAGMNTYVHDVMNKLREKMDPDGIGGEAWVRAVESMLTRTENTVANAKIVRDLAAKRHLGKTWEDLAEKSFDHHEDTDALIDRSMSAVTEVEHRTSSETVFSHIEILNDAAKYLKARSLDPKAYRGVPTGILPLDTALLGGLPYGEFSVVGARPSVGKTALGLAMAHGAAQSGHPTLFVSVEMSNRQIALRLMAMRSGVDLSVTAQEDIPDETFERLLSAVEQRPIESNIYFDDITKEPYSISRVVRRAVRQYGIKAVWIDYVQLCDPPRTHKDRQREEQVSHTSRIFKGLAKELNIHVCALAQLNRNAEFREDRKPQLGDLRESGSLEQDADQVLLLWRPEQSGIMNVTISGQEYDSKGYLEVNIAKYRNGPTGYADLWYDKSRGMFGPWRNGE